MYILEPGTMKETPLNLKPWEYYNYHNSFLFLEEKASFGTVDSVLAVFEGVYEMYLLFDLLGQTERKLDFESL